MKSAPAARSLWWMVLTGGFVTLVTLAFARLAYGVLLPEMQRGLGLSYGQAGNLGTVTALGYFATVMLAGLAARRWGARNTVLLGVATVSAGFVGLALASAYPLLLVLMALLGIGTAFTYTPLISALAAWFPQQRGLVIGLATSGIGLGLVSVGFLVPALTAWQGEGGWRWAWGLFAVTGAAVCGLVAAFLRDPPRPPVRSTSGSAGAWAVYRNPRVITVGLVYAAVGLTSIVQTLFMVSFMRHGGVPGGQAGQLVAVNGLLSVFSGVVWGWLSDRLGRGASLMLALGLVLLATLAPVLWPTLAVFTLHYVVLGCTVTGLFTLIQAAGTEQVAAEDMPLALSYVTLFFAAGQFLGPALAGGLIDRTGSFPVAFALSSAVLAAGLALAARIRAFSRRGRGAAADSG
ncbi:MFS transporter [Deinococcus aluminii]|uniref:Major facilitator superfamily (MFS) profile domain-containing protein n=1 Tax=Deinococcus aluminii TaxID=1656885 RepID=A0ABP9XCD7_9DEIO